MLSKFYTRRDISSWDRVMAEYGKFTKATSQAWIFRGQDCAKRGLETSLQRALREFQIKAGSEGQYEGGLIRQFKRRSHHYLQAVPQKDDWFEWMSLMQHYGAPTRLQDWTYSFFVALFFAFENAQTSCSVWALNSTWVAERVSKLVGPSLWRIIMKSDRNLVLPKTFKRLFAMPAAKRKPLVLAVNPYRLNDRLSAQQAVFLCPGDISKSFEENLEALFNHPGADKNFIKLDFAFDKALRQEIIAHLIRMNVTRTSLFPGLDGFARSLRLALARPEVVGVADPYFPT